MLEVEHVRRAFGTAVAVEDVTFRIERGTTFGLLGPNGAGKTTTMRIILGILAADAGTVRWDGAAIDGKVRRRFGYLPEERGLYGNMKVRDQIAYFARLHGVAASEVAARTGRWLHDLELEQYATRTCSELSKGNQQKVQVACAAVHEPELLILDEPFSGLDPQNAEMLYRNFERMRAAGTTLVLSSHQLWQLETLCDAFCVIAGGRTRTAGTLGELRSHWATRTMAVSPGGDAVRTVLGAIPGAGVPSQRAGELRVEVPAATDPAPVLRELVGVERITRFEVLEPSLQEIYLRAIDGPAA